VAFHVEIRWGHRWAREFNLDAERLRRDVTDPWTRNRPLRLGDRDWEPAECSLTIFEGPELSGPELAFGRGWDRARSSGRAVTRELVPGAARDAAVAVLAETDAGRDMVASALAELGAEAIEWPAREGAAVLVLAVESPDPPRGWLFEAGAAVGAVGGRAVVVRLTEAPAPSELGDLASADPERELAPALADALGKLRPA